jgi:hypothetical protein
VVAGTSLGIKIVDMVMASGTMVSPFMARHEAILAGPFPSTSCESAAEYAHYPYPPIRDPHARSPCIGFYSGFYIAALADINLEFNLPVPSALVYLLDGQIMAEDEVVARIPSLCSQFWTASNLQGTQSSINTIKR